MELSDIYQKASLVQIPSGYKSGTLYSVVPNTSSGDFTVTGDPQGEATRVNKDGLIESVAANVPRLNYDLTNPQNPHLLLEPTRTNSLTYSEDFTNAAYSKQGTSSVSSNTTIAPDGSLTADTLSGATGTSVSGNVLRRNVSGTVDATLSIYVKSLGSTSFTIYIRNGSSGAVQSQSITPNGNWQRVTVTSNPNNGQIFFGNTNGDVAIWGAQLEAGNYPTSYIPTAGSAVTRTADTCVDAGNNTIISSLDGSVFVDLTTINDANLKQINLFDGGNNRITIQVQFTTLSIGIVSNVGGTIQTLYDWDVNINTNDIHKIAIRYEENNSKLYYNGLSQTPTTFTGSWFNNGVLDNFSFDKSGAFTFYGKIHQAMIFNEALTDSELQTLTT